MLQSDAGRGTVEKREPTFSERCTAEHEQERVMSCTRGNAVWR